MHRLLHRDTQPTFLIEKVEIQVRKIYCIDRAAPVLPISIEDTARSEAEIEQLVRVNQDTRLNNRQMVVYLSQFQTTLDQLLVVGEWATLANLIKIDGTIFSAKSRSTADPECIWHNKNEIQIVADSSTKEENVTIKLITHKWKLRLSNQLKELKPKVTALENQLKEVSLFPYSVTESQLGQGSLSSVVVNANVGDHPLPLGTQRFIFFLKVAKALFDGQLLDVYFTRSFYKHILGVKVTYHDIEAVDPNYYKNLKWMLENDVNDIPDIAWMRMKKSTSSTRKQRYLIMSSNLFLPKAFKAIQFHLHLFAALPFITKTRFSAIPSAVFFQPPIGQVGLGEQQVTCTAVPAITMIFFGDGKIGRFSVQA
ncbi:E3 ubiquitin protein ligase UPL2 [Tanacetum coccineum]